MTTDKRLDTIAKLLAKAESTNYPAEAEALTAQAERMMIRYGIDKATVDAERGRRGQTREKIVERRRPYRGRYRDTFVEGIGGVLQEMRLVTTLQSGLVSRPELYLYLIGAESDVDQMCRLADSLKVQAEHAMTYWWKAGPDRGWMSEHEKRVERRTYLRGWFVGAAARAALSVADALKEYGPGSGTELVLADRQARAQAAAEEMYPGVEPARDRRLRQGSDEAKAAGIRDGLKANVNGRELAGRGALTS